MNERIGVKESIILQSTWDYEINDQSTPSKHKLREHWEVYQKRKQI